MRYINRSVTAAAIILLVVLTIASGCAYDTYPPGPYARSSVQYRPAYNYDYHYYPSAQAYFHLYSGYYYYRPYNTWLRVRTLPPGIYLGPRERVHLRVWSSKPYLYHDIHRQRYHPYPGYRRDRNRDRYERRYNRTHHEQYQRRLRR